MTKPVLTVGGILNSKHSKAWIIYFTHSLIQIYNTDKDLSQFFQGARPIDNPCTSSSIPHPGTHTNCISNSVFLSNLGSLLSALEVRMRMYK